MKVDSSEKHHSPGVMITLSVEEAGLLAAALRRATYVDIPPDLQAPALGLAEELLAVLEQSSGRHGGPS